MTKGRESGMPEEECWSGFFDAGRVIETLFGDADCPGSVVEFGCGYGTFTFPAAQRSTGTVNTFDIEPDLVLSVQRQAERDSVTNIRAQQRDFVASGTGLEPGSQRHAMIYNLLHIENPGGLLGEARRVLHPTGRLSVIHWRSDIPTQRGPALPIRPTPEACIAWIEASGFRHTKIIDLQDCCEYHYGIVAFP